MHAPRGTDVACRHGFAPAVVAVSYSAQLPPPDAAASTAAAPVTRHGVVARDLKPAGEGEQHEVSERVPGLFRPAATGPIRAEDPASGSTGRPVRLHSLPSRAPGDIPRLHLSRRSRYLRKPRAATVRWGEPVARGKRVRDSTVRFCDARHKGHERCPSPERWPFVPLYSNGGSKTCRLRTCRLD